MSRGTPRIGIAKGSVAWSEKIGRLTPARRMWWPTLELPTELRVANEHEAGPDLARKEPKARVRMILQPGDEVQVLLGGKNWLVGRFWRNGWICSPKCSTRISVAFLDCEAAEVGLPQFLPYSLLLLLLYKGQVVESSGRRR